MPTFLISRDEEDRLLPPPRHQQYAMMVEEDKTKKPVTLTIPDPIKVIVDSYRSIMISMSVIISLMVVGILVSSSSSSRR